MTRISPNRKWHGPHSVKAAKASSESIKAFHMCPSFAQLSARLQRTAAAKCLWISIVGESCTGGGEGRRTSGVGRVSREPGANGKLSWGWFFFWQRGWCE